MARCPRRRRNRPSNARLWARGLTRRCAVCGQGHLFVRWFTMVDRCPRCGLVFERIEGHWTGDLGINTVVSFGALLLTLLGGFFLTYPEVNGPALLVAAVLVAVVTPDRCSGPSPRRCGSRSIYSSGHPSQARCGSSTPGEPPVSPLEISPTDPWRPADRYARQVPLHTPRLRADPPSPLRGRRRRSSTVSRESKVLIGVGALVVIGLVLALIGQPTIGVIAVLIGLIAGVAGLRFTKPDASDPFAEARTEADRSNTGTLTPERRAGPVEPRRRPQRLDPADRSGHARRPRRPTSPGPGHPDLRGPDLRRAGPRPRPTRRPTYALRSRRARARARAGRHRVVGRRLGLDRQLGPRGRAALDSRSTSQRRPPAARVPQPSTSSRLHGADSNPLDDLVGLDSLDPIAEVERIEGRSTSLFGGDPTFQAPIINEQVSTADDIMAASQATELNLGDSGEQTELQKLLAKVQIRLSAYE